MRIGRGTNPKNNPEDVIGIARTTHNGTEVIVRDRRENIWLNQQTSQEHYTLNADFRANLYYQNRTAV
ncbi:hypothetical protein C922_05547 [Plasmodium inui San Antonio 1]|uniref:Uncharacterized protein n=1 Tax=Plasmodium inui San Antonio 1 TaxID=1237626 RepID=W7A4Q5_9APIC|nr:hypothetical protein C922_05547 [Plasmodium inui San Antonio 1]EUD64074.1 hypothetical protein C922_05547 [Plasmodium inui San Antonio 1]